MIIQHLQICKMNLTSYVVSIEDPPINLHELSRLKIVICLKATFVLLQTMIIRIIMFSLSRIFQLCFSDGICMLRS